MRLLVVEDYEPLREAVTRRLREEGYAVDAAADGAEGWWYAKSNDYDVILLDLMLPELDGETILRRIKAAGRNTRVLILSAKDRVEQRVSGLDAGADDYLIKPFAMDEMLARVRTLVRRRYDLASPQIRAGDLELNSATKTATIRGRLLDLTAREYSLLEYLAARCGQVVSRTDIWEHLYDFDSDAQSNVVDVYIGYLRKKLDLHGAAGLIVTRRGQGYLLQVESDAS
jgi:DNA-binding response OmpR family regulator